ncbi:hypothetical protein CLOACE_10710 [Clostridium acetireducens DSM 10703]|jgi:uncharacterized membrane protein YgaE (UPF0421/DUF939 family)|uniref:Fusaric acid resistance protein family protein n=1 Tax=Clostridium acetireducens DSM 10703 TaxID=1121290 RepID=A0A1E8EZA1_9CLOT|nr:aromatic acid exporter family protein [Clostridium acetireducens]OFI06298.1 hypothetical protein CLOACE_10710 [Clostridium acetireducens DSM 10703]
MKKIGLRNIKTAFAVSLCIVLFDLCHRQYPFYACIASISCMKQSVSSTHSAGRYRIIGTCIGATVGLIFYMFFKESALSCGIGIVLVIYFCNLFKQNNSVVISCIVFIAIMTNLKGMPSEQYAINRIIDTFIGIVIAVLVDKFLDCKFKDKVEMYLNKYNLIK